MPGITFCLSPSHIKWETGNGKWESGNGKWESGNGKLETPKTFQSLVKSWIVPREMRSGTQTRIPIFKVSPSGPFQNHFKCEKPRNNQ